LYSKTPSIGKGTQNREIPSPQNKGRDTARRLIVGKDHLSGETRRTSRRTVLAEETRGTAQAGGRYVCTRTTGSGGDAKRLAGGCWRNDRGAADEHSTPQPAPSPPIYKGDQVSSRTSSDDAPPPTDPGQPSSRQSKQDEHFTGRDYRCRGRPIGLSTRPWTIRNGRSTPCSRSWTKSRRVVWPKGTWHEQRLSPAPSPEAGAL